jgi:hypothetical protein
MRGHISRLLHLLSFPGAAQECSSASVWSGAVGLGRLVRTVGARRRRTNRLGAGQEYRARIKTQEKEAAFLSTDSIGIFRVIPLSRPCYKCPEK